MELSLEQFQCGRNDTRKEIREEFDGPWIGCEGSGDSVCCGSGMFPAGKSMFLSSRGGSVGGA